ncbi:AAA family ATPase [Thalassotalea euphylliae]|uniref:Transcriptional antiterminator n=1 Tax=Thalassotalea euphylliae TaxID=1655234 RepID=A0A3E0U2X8_9GAMM|nr:AAA family ATPase [Thalassotalea euphylliae]REL31286.1 transcriptional antiterminator [Thalassotalea euphylliae]
MTLPENVVPAIYVDPGVERYRHNPFIESLPQIKSIKEVRDTLQGEVRFNPKDIFSKNEVRVHEIAGLLDDFFQPIGSHLQLEEKISIMIRSGYVGRNISDGSLNTQLQNGYERIMSGDLNAFRFKTKRSTAQSLTLIGVSGCGKSTTLNRILAMYPDAIYHEKYNFIQIPYLIIQCPFNGSLKNLCLNFFRALDRVINSNFEKKYTRNRLSPDVLLTLMAQAANSNAIGLLVIDEIQRLSQKRSDDREDMLEFFVQLVNVIGIPVVLVGTPKARPIFEVELQSARRSAGFGSLFWSPMKNLPATVDLKTGKTRPSEWIAFTDKLWRYQWLRKRDEVISDEIRDCWFELSQGVLDIAVKLFVLAQMRAIATRKECISVNLLRQVYQDELKPVHLVLDALRSNDPTRIAKYSDLRLHDIDKRILELSQEITKAKTSQDEDIDRFNGNEQALRLLNLLKAMDCDSDLLIPFVQRAFDEYPNLSVRALMPIVLKWYEDIPNKPLPLQRGKNSTINSKHWCELEKQDLRFQYAQCDGKDMHQTMRCNDLIFNMESWLLDMN